MLLVACGNPCYKNSFHLKLSGFVLGGGCLIKGMFEVMLGTFHVLEQFSSAL